MARTVRNAKTDTRTARARLPKRREPFWVAISSGCALGYRHGANGGTWIAKFRDETGQRHYEAIGAADDARDADGLSVYSFSQAQEKARTFFARKAREVAGDLAPHDGPYTVASAIADYLKAYERRGGKAVRDARLAAEAHINPPLGKLAVSRLTAGKVEGWHQGLAEAPPRARTKLGAAQRHRKPDKTADGTRRRRATANRVLTILKAALNHAWEQGRASTDDAWRRVKPFKGVEMARVRYLSADESTRLANACSGAFRDLVAGGLLTGCRYSELAAMRAADFNDDAGVVVVRTSKSGKPRHVVLTDEGRRVFARITAGKGADALVFQRDDGGAWGKSYQMRPMQDACKAAEIKPAVSFHILRHTHGSMLAMRGVPMAVIAKQLGHAGTRMTEMHYAHLAPSYVADTIREHFPALGLAGKTNVTRMRRKGAG